MSHMLYLNKYLDIKTSITSVKTKMFRYNLMLRRKQVGGVLRSPPPTHTHTHNTYYKQCLPNNVINFYELDTNIIALIY